MSLSDFARAPRCRRGHVPALTGVYRRWEFRPLSGTAYERRACRLCRIEDSTRYWQRKGGRAKVESDGKKSLDAAT